MYNGTLTATGVGGHDTIAGDGTLFGGAGSDSITIGHSGEAYGGDGDAVIYVNKGNGSLEVWDGAGNDYISDSSTTGQIHAGGGDDRVVVAQANGRSLVDGGAGDDLMYCSGGVYPNQGLLFALDAGTGAMQLRVGGAVWQ